MFDPVLWGLVQGLTEFLPISSSGHLVFVPALLGRAGPDLPTSAMLHLGTLVALLVYFRGDVVDVLRFGRSGRRLLTLLLIGTIPAAVVGLALESTVARLEEEPRVVAVALLVTGVILLGTQLLRLGDRRTEDARPWDALVVGIAQATAILPGISRSGTTIAAGLGRGLNRAEAARFGFLLGIPAVAAAGALETLKVVREGAGITGGTLLGMVVAGVAGYAAIAVLLRVLRRVGLLPFAVYCLFAGTLALLLL